MMIMHDSIVQEVVGSYLAKAFGRQMCVDGGLRWCFGFGTERELYIMNIVPSSILDRACPTDVYFTLLPHLTHTFQYMTQIHPGNNNSNSINNHSNK